MQKLLKNRKIQILCIIGIVALAIPIILSLTWAYEQETYASIKDCGANPPFEGVYWGMTIPEFCEAMGVEESDLVRAEPLHRDNWSVDVARAIEEYDVTAKELPLYEWEKNNYYLALTEPILGCSDYYIDDQPLTVRLIFTEETFWMGKTVPPLLRAILFKFPYEDRWAVGNEANLYYFNEELQSNAEFSGAHGFFKPWLKHEEAYNFSRVYTSGKIVESEEEWESMSKRVTFYESIRSVVPTIIFDQKVIDIGWTLEWDKESIYVAMDAGYYAYYEWFLNELT